MDVGNTTLLHFRPLTRASNLATAQVVQQRFVVHGGIRTETMSLTGNAGLPTGIHRLRSGCGGYGDPRQSEKGIRDPGFSEGFSKPTYHWPIYIVDIVEEDRVLVPFGLRLRNIPRFVER